VTSNTVILRPERDDTNVVKLASAGDAEAFATLYERYRDRIRAVCLRMIKDSFLAEDMMQQTFLCAFRCIRTFRGESSFVTWLHRIAVNEVLMHLRRCKISPIENANRERPNPEEDPHEAECFHVEDRNLTHAIERIELEQAIASLPPGYRIMFVLHDIKGFEHTEIASILGCSPGNTKSQLFKARKRLRELLMDYSHNSNSNRKTCDRIAA
jgi:RNA polymerase sigma-70 factor (ECF subfamily)